MSFHGSLLLDVDGGEPVPGRLFGFGAEDDEGPWVSSKRIECIAVIVVPSGSPSGGG